MKHLPISHPDNMKGHLLPCMLFLDYFILGFALYTTYNNTHINNQQYIHITYMYWYGLNKADIFLKGRILLSTIHLKRPSVCKQGKIWFHDTVMNFLAAHKATAISACIHRRTIHTPEKKASAHSGTWTIKLITPTLTTAPECDQQ